VAACLLTGCKTATVTGTRDFATSTVAKPALIYVTDFDLGVQNIKHEDGILSGRSGPLGGVGRRLSGASSDPEARARKLVDLMSESLVKDLSRAGFNALRLPRGTVLPVEGWLIRGVFTEVQEGILKAHAGRLTQETGKTVTADDIVAGRAPRPRVLDMFAGGGAIPLEALRLGCQAYALDLNPVAHIIQLCTLVYPQKFGKPDQSARGMTGPMNDRGETTWGGLAEEVRYWGDWVLNKAKGEIGDLYPLLPDPEYKGKKQVLQADYLKDHATDDVPPGYLMPVAYLWTRTVTCKNPICKAIVPLVRQTWLCNKDKRCIALKMIAPRGSKQVRFEVVEACSENGLGFDPAGFSSGGNATCPFCGTVADIDYVKSEGCARRIRFQVGLVLSVSRSHSSATACHFPGVSSVKS
jgi:hypothetical protein